MNYKIKASGYRNKWQGIRPGVLISVMLVLVIAVIASIFLPSSLEKKEPRPIASVDLSYLASADEQIKQNTKENKNKPNICLKEALRASAGMNPSQFASAPSGVEKIIAEVMQALDSADEDVRQNALEKLRGIRTDSLNAPLQKALRDPNQEVREQALEVMSEIRSPEIIQSLAIVLSLGDEGMREAALDILEDIEDPRSIDVIIELGLKDKSEIIWEAALNSLEYMTQMRFRSYEDARLWWSFNKNAFKF